MDMRLDQNQRKTEENRVEGSCNWFSNFRDSLFLVLKFGGYSGFVDNFRGGEMDLFLFQTTFAW